MGKGGVITSKTGVTVKQVLIASAKYWGAKASGSEGNYIDCLGDHCFFEGWDAARITEKGGVTLVPFFGS